MNPPPDSALRTPHSALPPSLFLPFAHAGKTRQLTKHPRVQDAYRHGRITLEVAQAKPWYLRVKFPGDKRKRLFALGTNAKQAVADALDKLNGHVKRPDTFRQWLTERDARRGLTVGALATEWLAAECPFSQVKPRTPAQAEPLQENLRCLRPWWDVRPWASITARTLEEYVLWRRQQVRARYPDDPRRTGDRSADLELAALSCLGQWAVLTGRVDINPFAKRPRFQDSSQILHCHERMPENDEQLHAILHWLFTHRNPEQPGQRHRPEQVDFNQRVAGGWLAFCALTGLRPGEPAVLQYLRPTTQFPANLRAAPCGLIYPMPDGNRRMKIARLKGGQNPAIKLHPALTDFLNVWTAWLDRRGAAPGSSLFPVASQLVADHLTRACAKLGLPHLTPHGFGRAYYVRVRRSQGEEDSSIAVELGQTSDGQLIRSVYGDPVDPVGGNLHDWLPAPSATGQAAPTAWAALAEEMQSTIVPLKFG